MTRPLAGHPRRRGIPRVPRHVIRVLTEGKITEPDYLTKWARLNRRKVRLEIRDSGMTPVPGPSCEGVREAEPSDEAFGPGVRRDLVRIRRGINVAVSNPCFELWLVLHREEQTAYIDRGDIQQRSDILQLTANKRILPVAEPILVDAVDMAKQRARALDRRHADNGSPPRSNPSTDAWRLVDRLRAGMQGGPT